MRETNVQKTEQILIDNYEKYYRLAYSYTRTQEDALDEAISASEKAVILDFGEASPNAKKLAVSFARSFSDLTDEQLDAIKKLMQNEENK